MLVRVNEHKCEIVKTPVNEKEINITKVEFEFTDAITNDYVKEAYFTLNGETYKQIIVNNECDIPYEVLTQKGQIEIGVVAFLVEDEEEIKRYNPSPAYFETWIGSLKDNAENSEPITPSEMEQYEQALQDGLTEVNDKLDDIDQALIDVNTAITETNNLNLDVSKSGKTATVTLTKKDNTTKVVTLSDGTSLEFNWNGTSLGIKTDDDADYTYVDLQGVQGEQGPMGAPFTIKKTYSSVAEMNADFNNMNVGDYVMITSSVEVEDNAKLYCKGTEAWIFITDFSGATGIQGPTGATPNIQIGTVTTGETSSVTRSGTNENPVLNFVLEKGETGATGQTGATGNGIASISKTSTVGAVDIYTITYTNGQTTTFTVTNGEVTLSELEYCRLIENALPNASGSGTSLTINNTVESPMRLELEPSELSQDAEPTPTSPQDIHTISGDNAIKITGANIQRYTVRDYSTYHYNCDEKGQVTIIGTNSGQINNLAYNLIANNPMTLDAGNYTLKLIGSKSQLTTIRVMGDDIALDANNEYHFTISEKVEEFYVSFKLNSGEHNDNFYITLAKGNVATTERYQEQNLPLNLGNLEYCKIGNYKDQFIKPSGKNLLNEVYYNDSTLYTKNGSFYAFVELPDTFKTKFYVNMSVKGTSQNMTFGFSSTSSSMFSGGIKVLNNGTINSNVECDFTNSDHVYLAIANPSGITLNTDISKVFNNYNIMVSTTSNAEYEPYDNGKWYLKKKIDKLILDGDTNISGMDKELTNSYRFYTAQILTNSVNNVSMSSHFPNSTSGNINTVDSEALTIINNKQVVMRVNKTIATTTSQLSAWLSTNNVTDYHVLTTPIYILLNDTLQAELDNIYNWAKSYQNQTNISQTNADLPFIIKYKAITGITNSDISNWNGKQDALVSGTNIKTINNQSILGSGNISISGGGGSSTDVQINGTSIVSNDVANIVTESTYNASTNKIATMSDLPSVSDKLDANKVKTTYSTTSGDVYDVTYVNTTVGNIETLLGGI